MMIFRELAMRSEHAATKFAPVVWNQIRKHHVWIRNGQIEGWRPHTRKEAADLRVTEWFANRHIVEVHGDNDAPLSPNLMHELAYQMLILRSQGAGIRKRETPEKNTAIAIRTDLSAFPHSNGVVTPNVPGVLGIATKTQGQSSPVINTSAVVTRNKDGIVNHLDSSN